MQKREMESLIGYLNFTCSVVLPGRAFLRRLISSIMGIKEPYHYVKISAEMKSDLLLWKTFVGSFNGKSMFLHDRFLSSSVLSLYTDTAASLGYETVYSSYWFYGEFPPTVPKAQYNIAGTVSYCYSGECFGPSFAESQPENLYRQSSFSIHPKSYSSKDKHIIKLLRCLVFACLKHNVMF